MVTNGGLNANWVPGLIRSWPSHLKGDGSSDYHSNFNGELFEKWFEELCQVLRWKYGPCRIHMDGAAYHRILEDPSPSSSKSKAVMVKWLHDHGVTVVITGYTKKQPERLKALGREDLGCITSREWLGSYNKMRKKEKVYMELAPPPQSTPAPYVHELQHLTSVVGMDTTGGNVNTTEEYDISF
uniref:Uncharacterized protein n=1 Tax=Phytophthora ramorum TaxID=164328 RepID=H3GWH7_PHYRM